MMRVSTLGFTRNSVNSLLDQQARLARTQNEVATGVRVRTSADDPIAAARISSIQRVLDESKQYTANASLAQVRLQTEEQALADANGVLQRVRELVVQGSSATVGPEERRMISAEIRGRIDEVLAIANRTDGRLGSALRQNQRDAVRCQWPFWRRYIHERNFRKRHLCDASRCCEYGFR
jgi:flagellar hook-associated protein 3 FlgL